MNRPPNQQDGTQKDESLSQSQGIIDCRGEEPVYGSRHGENSWSLHLIEDVDLIKPDYSHHQHLENIARLDRFPTSPSSDSPSNCRILCTEKTNHHTSQPMKTKHIIMTTKTNRNFLYLPVSLRWRNILFMGEMLEEQVSMPTWTLADLVDQPTKSVSWLNRD